MSPGGLSWSIRRRLRNPLSFTGSPAPPARCSWDARHLLARLSLRARAKPRDENGERNGRGASKKRKQPPHAICPLVFVRDCSVHVKCGPPTCRLEMKLGRVYLSSTLSCYVRDVRVIKSREGQGKKERLCSENDFFYERLQSRRTINESLL